MRRSAGSGRVIQRSLVVVGLALGLAAAPGPASAEIVVLDRAEFVAGVGEQPPAESADWEPVRLPHAWSDFEPGRRMEGWYRFTVPELDTQGDRLGIYLPRFILNAAVHLDGHWVGQCGRFHEPLARCWNQPMLLELPEPFSASHGATLHVRLAGYPPFSRLEPVRVGPASELAPEHQRRTLLQVGLSRAGTAAGLMMVLFMFALWVATRDPVYGSFALAVATWNVNMLNAFLVEPDIPHWLFEWSIHVAIDASAVCTVFFVHRYFGLRHRRRERALIAFACVSAGATALSIPGHFHWVVLVLHSASVLLVVYMSAIAAAALRGLGWADRVPWFGFLGVVMGVAAMDLLAQAEIRDFTSTRYFPYMIPAMTIFVGTSLTFRFLRQFARARNMNVELEQRVREKHSELEANFVRLRELEDARVLLAERERIMREVHDGLGGQLVSTLAMVESGDVSSEDIAHAIRGSLDDMYLVIDSLDPDVDEISTLLGMVRGRLEPRLLRHGLRFEWDVTDLPKIPRLGSHELLHVLRIVQEAITNILKHASARIVRVSTSVREGPAGGPSVDIEIADDGVGLASDGAPGRGLGNMRDRAAAIDARLTFSAAEPGTRVRLCIPVDPA